MAALADQSTVEADSQGEPDSQSGKISVVARRATAPSRQNHISLYIDDYIDADRIEAVGMSAETARKAARWIDAQIRLVMAALRNAGEPVRGQGEGLVSCTLERLAVTVTGVEVSQRKEGERV